MQDPTRFLQVSHRIYVSKIFLKIFKVYKETFNLLIRSCNIPRRQLQKSCKYLLGSYKVPSKHSSWWRHLEDVFRLRLQKTSSRRLQDVLRTSSRHLQDVLKTSSRRLQNVFKTSSRRLQDVFKTFWRRLQDVFEMSSRHLQDFPQRYLQDVFKA